MNTDNCTPKEKKFKHLNYEERQIIQKQLDNRATKIQISKLLNRGASTIKREIKREIV